MTAPHRMTATDLVQHYRAGRLTPSDAVADILAQRDRVNPVLNALIAVDDAAARTMAADSTARWRAGTPLSAVDGVPLTVKDNIHVAGFATAWGSPLFRDERPMVDELPVARLRAGGAVILGKTNVPEFTSQGYTDNALFGSTGNPWNPALTPGGSSGGAVACVASGVGPVALGTDGGGSIRRPAGHAGVAGLKPTAGRVARRDGLPAILLDFEVIGPIARTIGDLATLMAVMAPADRGDPASLTLPAWVPPRPETQQRILFVPRFGGHPVDPAITASVARAAGALAALGHHVEEGKLPFDPDEAALVQATIGPAGLAWLMAERGGTPALPALRAMAESGAALSAATLFGVLDRVSALRRLMSVFFDDWDAILTPAAAAQPWPRGESHPPEIDGQAVGPRGHAVFTAFANIAGLCGLTLPCNPAPDGMPIGMQLVGAAGADAILLGIGLAYEMAHPWADRWPALAEH